MYGREACSEADQSHHPGRERAKEKFEYVTQNNESSEQQLNGCTFPESNIVFYKVDITDSSAIASVAKAIRTEHGDPTVLINNAGIGNAATILDVTEEKLRKLFDVNLVAPFLLVQEFLPSMVRNNHGHIVNIASMASFATQACNVDYACSKSAVLSFHEGLTQELRHIYKSSKVRTR